MRLVLAFLPLLILCSAVEPTRAQAPPTYRGRSLQSVLEELRAAGLPIVYSSNLVPSDLRVEAEPTSTDPLDRVKELLAPHGLTIEVSGGAWLVVRAPPSADTAPPSNRPANESKTIVTRRAWMPRCYWLMYWARTVSICSPGQN